MKRIVTLLLALLLICGIFSNTYAASSYSIILTPSETQLEKGDEFTVAVKIVNIIDSKGIITIRGKINYDETSLTLLRIEQGHELWSKPKYYAASKYFIQDRDEDRTKSDEVLFKIVFKVNENSIKNPSISISELSASNGDIDIYANTASTRDRKSVV